MGGAFAFPNYFNNGDCDRAKAWGCGGGCGGGCESGRGGCGGGLWSGGRFGRFNRGRGKSVS